MNLDTSLFVRNLVTGTVSYLKEIDFDLTAKQENTYVISQAYFTVTDLHTQQIE